MSTIAHFPHELLSLIFAHVYAAGLPSATPSLDPLYLLPAGAPTSQPASYPPACWSEPVTRRTLASATLVNRAWAAAARPWLWQRLEIRLPRGWLALVNEIAGSVGPDAELDPEAAQREVDESIHEAALVVAKARGAELDADATRKMEEAIFASLGPDAGIPPELLSPPASREPSPRRLRSKSRSPARWKIIRTISDAMQDVMYRGEDPVYVPPIEDSRPGRFVQHLDFNHFRTIGMRRSVDEGVNSRFVTGDRLEALLKETPNLVTFGATEYMDGALTLPVLRELFLRGSAARMRGHPARGRGPVVEDPDDPDVEDVARRRDCRELEAVDFTGCVSGVMVNAFADFVNLYLAPEASRSRSPAGSVEDFGGRRKRRARFAEESLVFSSLQRFSLRGAKSLAPQVLAAFVLACPSLTHLDLSGTRADPPLLEALGASGTVRLESLALARCIRLTGESIHDFLVHAPAARDLCELNLYGDCTFPCPLSREQLQSVIQHAPCFVAGKLRYLDLSSASLDGPLLRLIPSQPNLRSLGLAHIPDLPLAAVAQLLKDRAPNVEVVVLLGTSPELGARTPGRHPSLTLHTQLIGPLCVPPFSFDPNPRAAPTRLRVIELAPSLLAALGGGAGAWRVVKSKGGRGWYVDTASGWAVEAGSGNKAGFRRDIPKGHPWREALEGLASANGNVSSGVGWHARKMEVLCGHGLLGREDGLYGAVSYAYQG